MIKLADLTHAFGVTRNTVKLWGIEYSDYLSDGANPGHGVMREYTLQDAQVLARVYELRQAYKPKEEIHAALSAGELGSWPTFAQAAEEAEREGGDAPAGAMQLLTQLTARAASLEGELNATKQERDRLLVDLQAVRAAALDAEKRAAAAEAEAKILHEKTARRWFWQR